MRVYFHLRAKHDTIPDLEGVETANAEEALTAAVEMLREFRQEDAWVARNWTGWTLEATDETGRVLFSLNLDTPV
jgi:hypothetical protein